MDLEYTSAQLESAMNNLEVFSKHFREYMAEQGEWVECTQPPTQSAFPQDMSTVVAKSGGIGVPITQTIVDLTTIMEHTDDLKGSSVNKVLRMWPSHYKQFDTFVTKMSETRIGRYSRLRTPRSFKAR